MMPGQGRGQGQGGGGQQNVAALIAQIKELLKQGVTPEELLQKGVPEELIIQAMEELKAEAGQPTQATPQGMQQQGLGGM